jgi:hypothetical protein
MSALISKKYIIIITSVFISVLFFLNGCKKDSDLPPANMGYRYFPANTGHWAIYLVDSIAWNAFNGSVDTFQYQIKEVIESEFIDDQGRNTLRIERYKRMSDTIAWVIKDVWFANRTPSTAERVEENIRYVRLIFPVKEGDEWNGNATNTLDREDYSYSDVHSPYTVGLHAFDSSLTVIQIDKLNLIQRDFAEEVYAVGAGLIYKKVIHVDTEVSGVITNGEDYSYTLVDWGE